MNEKGFIAYLFRTMLAEHFKTKAGMARALDVSLQTLRLNFKNLERAKGGATAFEKLIVYCCQNNIELVSMYNRYMGEVSASIKGGLVRRRFEACFILAALKLLKTCSLTDASRWGNVFLVCWCGCCA